MTFLSSVKIHFRIQSRVHHGNLLCLIHLPMWADREPPVLSDRIYRLFDNSICLVTVLLGDYQWRDHTDRMGANGSDQKASVQTFMLYLYAGNGIVKFNTYQQSLAADFFHMRKLF